MGLFIWSVAIVLLDVYIVMNSYSMHKGSVYSVMIVILSSAVLIFLSILSFAKLKSYQQKYVTLYYESGLDIKKLHERDKSALRRVLTKEYAETLKEM